VVEKGEMVLIPNEQFSHHLNLLRYSLEIPLPNKPKYLIELLQMFFPFLSFLCVIPLENYNSLPKVLARVEVPDQKVA